MLSFSCWTITKIKKRRLTVHCSDLKYRVKKHLIAFYESASGMKKKVGKTSAVSLSDSIFIISSHIEC